MESFTQRRRGAEEEKRGVLTRSREGAKGVSLAEGNVFLVGVAFRAADERKSGFAANRTLFAPLRLRVRRNISAPLRLCANSKR